MNGSQSTPQQRSIPDPSRSDADAWNLYCAAFRELFGEKAVLELSPAALQVMVDDLRSAFSEIERTNAAPPVAWRYRNAGGGWTYLGYPPVGLGALAEIEPLYALSEIGGTKHAFMDGIDWQHHLGIDNDPKGASLYPSVEDTVREKKCLAGGGGCGVVEVEVRLVRWVIEQDLDSEIRRVDKRTNAATQEGVSARDAMPSPAGSGPLPAVAAPDKESNE